MCYWSWRPGKPGEVASKLFPHFKHSWWSYHTWVNERGASENTCRHLASLRKCFKFDNYNIKNYSKKEKVTSPRKVYINVEDAQRNMRSLLWGRGEERRGVEIRQPPRRWHFQQETRSNSKMKIRLGSPWCSPWSSTVDPYITLSKICIPDNRDNFITCFCFCFMKGWWKGKMG